MKQGVLQQARREISQVLDRYGLTWQQLYFDMGIPQEDIADYAHPKKIKDSLRKALIADEKGELLNSLPVSIERLRR